MTKKKNIDAEYGLDSRYTTNKEQQSEATQLMEARLNRMKNLSKEDITRAKLMQLKLKLESFISQPIIEKRNYFAGFLATYVDIIYSKRSGFAKDMDVTPVKLSQVINNHRAPSDEFILKLMIHSEKLFKNICDFDTKIWYKVYFHEKLCDTMLTQKLWRPKLEKQVRLSEPAAKYTRDNKD